MALGFDSSSHSLHKVPALLRRVGLIRTGLSSRRPLGSPNTIINTQNVPFQKWKRHLSTSALTNARAPWTPTSMVLLSLSLLFVPFKSSFNKPASDARSQELRLIEGSEEERLSSRGAATVGVLSLSHTLSYVGCILHLYILEPVAIGLRFLHLVLLFLPVVLSMPAVWIGPRSSSKDRERSGTIWWYGFLVKSMERAGPTFIKLGQWAASRTDIFPQQMCFLMSTLHSNVAPHAFAQTKEIIEQAFDGRSFDEIFLEFEEHPLGVGAIAQVYRAKLRRNLLPMQETTSGFTCTPFLKGSAQELLLKVDSFVNPSPPQIPTDWVAIKVLHPQVDRLIHRDLRIMRTFASLIDCIPTLEWLSLPDEVDKFGEMMCLQLDLRIEANNLLRFRENFKNRNTVTFPMPYMGYSTRQVLVEEFAHGIPLEAFLEEGGGVYQKQAADMGLDAFLHMLLIDNFAHADLHPGNILIRFYKPVSASIFSGLSWKFWTGSSTSRINEEKYDSHESFQVTEEALSRLRPLRGCFSKWQDELFKLSDEGFKVQLIFIDTGLVTELSPLNRQNFLDLFTAVAEFDGYKAGELMVDRCRQPAAVRDRDIFCLRMQHLVLGVKGRTFTLGKIQIADVLGEVMSMIRSHHVRLEGDFINVVVSILLLEGIGRRLDPNIDIFRSSLPILRQLGAQKGHEMLNKDMSILKIWLGLELRTILSSSLQDVDSLILMEYFWNE